MNKNKKTPVVVRLFTLFFVFVFSGFAWFLLVDRPRPTLNLLSVFPEDSLLVMEWHHAGKSWQRWRTSWPDNKKVVSDLFHLFDKQELLPSLFSEIDDLIAQYDAVADLPFMHLLADLPVALAVLPDNGGRTVLSKSLLEQSVLAMQTETKVSMENHPDLSCWFKPEATSTFQGESINHLVLPHGEKVVCWQRSDVIFFARKAALLHECIQLYLQQKIRHHPTFSDNPIVRRLKIHETFPADMFCYLDLDRLRGNVQWMNRLVEKIDILHPQHIVLYEYTKAQSTRFGTLATIKRGAGSLIDGFYRLPQPQGPIPHDVSSATSFLLWTNWFDPKKIWNFTLHHVPDEISGVLAAVEQAVSKQSGLTSDEFFDLIGHRIGLFMDAHQLSYQSDRILGCLSIEITDRNKVEQLVRQLTEDLQTITIQTGKTEIYSVMLAGGLLQPAYALEKNRLIIADNAGLIEQAQRYFMLDEHRDYQDLLGFHKDRGNLFLFVRPGGLLERFLPLLSVAARENRDPKRIFSSETRRKLRQYIIPLLTVLQKYEKLKFSGSITTNSVSAGIEFVVKPVQTKDSAH